jgi:hypothetical protein
VKSKVSDLPKSVETAEKPTELQGLEVVIDVGLNTALPPIGALAFPTTHETNIDTPVESVVIP